MGEKDGGHQSYLPRPDFRQLFTSPFVRRPPFGHEEYANVTIRRVELDDTGVIIEAHLVSEVISAFRLTPHDCLKITLNAPANKADGLVVWAAEAELVRGGYRVTGRAARVRPDIRQALEGQVENTLWDCRVNICRFYHAPCDLYSLGMIFWCMLLVNDHREEAEVCRQVENIGHRLTDFAELSNQLSPIEIEGKLREFLAEKREFFGPEAVFYRAMDRAASKQDIFGELWFACQKLGLAMVTDIPGFSLAAMETETRSIGNSAPVRAGLDKLRDLILWAEGRLFARRALGRELQAMADHV
jgi:hypothetical protein